MSFSQENAGPKPLLLKAAEVFMAVTLTVMVVAVFSNVVLRYVFASGLVIYDELSRLLFVWLVCMGSVVAAYEKKHLSFELVIDRVGPGTRVALYYFSNALLLVLLALVIKGAWDQVVAGLHSFSAVMGYPLALAAGATLFMAGAMEILVIKEVVFERLVLRRKP